MGRAVEALETADKASAEAATLGKIRCVLGLEGTDVDLVEAARTLRSERDLWKALATRMANAPVMQAPDSVGTDKEKKM